MDAVGHLLVLLDLLGGTRDPLLVGLLGKLLWKANLVAQVRRGHDGPVLLGSGHAQHQLRNRGDLLVAEEIACNVPVVPGVPVEVRPELEGGQRLLQRPLQVHAGVDQLAEPVEKLYEVRHVILHERQLGEIDACSVKRLHGTVHEVLVKFLQLRGRQVANRPTLHLPRNHVEHDLAELQLRHRAELQENKQEAIPGHGISKAR
mmetsp:Transcript_23452/g.73918  ORF Transcript_23452/g.73918 Transcript_23452/m.73918 type:complete len:204 (+) Transcript_23452:498-1109(+)